MATNNHLLGLLLTTLGLALFLQQTEGEGCLGSGTTLGDIDDTKLLVLQVLGELKEIVLADIVACKHDGRVLLVANEPCKRIAEGFDDGTCTQVAAADTGNNDHLTVFAEHIGTLLELIEESRGDG